MIDVTGPYLLILIYQGYGITSQIVESLEACKAALVQLEIVKNIAGYCVAATLE